MLRLKSTSRLSVSAVCAILFISACTTTSGPLDVYFIDVEGGKATLLISPEGETLLIDAGYPGKGKVDPVPGDPNSARDAQRIMAAANDANVSRIDYLLVSHFHRDHFGGVMELAQLIPIGTIVDHGTAAQEVRARPEYQVLLQAYEDTRRKSNHTVPAVGDQIPIRNIDVTVVNSAGAVVELPINGAGAPNPACDRPLIEPSEPYENPRSTGVLIQYGKFRFLDLGDLAGQPLSDLVCPLNRIGSVDVYLVPHHGGADSADPATFEAFRPRAAILNNGAIKGGAPQVFEALREVAWLEDVWQLHRSDNEGSKNFPSTKIANLDTQSEYWLRVSANADGSFRILNGRTGVWKSYQKHGAEN